MIPVHFGPIDALKSTMMVRGMLNAACTTEVHCDIFSSSDSGFGSLLLEWLEGTALFHLMIDGSPLMSVAGLNLPIPSFDNNHRLKSQKSEAAYLPFDSPLRSFLDPIIPCAHD
jgi:hypothetical protein